MESGPIRANSFSMASVHRRHDGPLAFCIGADNARRVMYLRRRSSSTSLVRAPTRGTDANRHGSPMVGRVLLD